VPRHVLGNNLAATDAILTQFPRQPAMISGGA
jgi:hypothetical protein